MSPRVVLVGPPGAGKSAVGVALAELLGVAARDTDVDVEHVAGRTVAEVVVDQGEPRFRELEREAVVAALAEHDGVLSLGGGAVMDPRTAADLAGHPVVYLAVGLADAARRIGLNASRPLLIGNPRAQWTRMMATRQPVYEAVAGHVVATDGLDVDQVAAQVRRVLAD